MFLFLKVLNRVSFVQDHSERGNVSASLKQSPFGQIDMGPQKKGESLGPGTRGAFLKGPLPSPHNGRRL